MCVCVCVCARASEILFGDRGKRQFRDLVLSRLGDKGTAAYKKIVFVGAVTGAISEQISRQQTKVQVRARLK